MGRRMALVRVTDRGAPEEDEDKGLHERTHRIVEAVAERLAERLTARLEQWLGLEGRGSEEVSELALVRARHALRSAGESVPRLLTKQELARALSTSPAQIDRLRRRYPGFPCEAVGEQSPRFDLQRCRAFLQGLRKSDTSGIGDSLAGVERISRRG